MAKPTTLAELVNTLPDTMFAGDLLQAIERLRCRPLDIYYAGPRSLRVDGVTLMVDLQPKQAVITHFAGRAVNVQVPR